MSAEHGHSPSRDSGRVPLCDYPVYDPSHSQSRGFTTIQRYTLASLTCSPYGMTAECLTTTLQHSHSNIVQAMLSVCTILALSVSHISSQLMRLTLHLTSQLCELPHSLAVQSLQHHSRVRLDLQMHHSCMTQITDMTNITADEVANMNLQKHHSLHV